MTFFSLLNIVADGLLVAGGPVGACAMLALSAHKNDETVQWQLFIFATVAGLCLPLLWVAAIKAFEYDLPLWPVGTFFIQAAVGAAVMIWLMRVVPQRWNSLTHKLTRKSVLERNRKTDVREIHKHLPDPQKPFNPMQFFNRQDGVFLGLTEEKKPLFIPRKKWPKMPHAAIMGTSGSGKGVALQILAAQWLLDGEAVIMVDPKDDEWLPHAMRQSAAASGKRHYFVNLRIKEAQIALFDGATADEIEECLIAGFSLNDTGTNADFYNIADRQYAGIVARAMAAERLTPAQAFVKFERIVAEHAPKFHGKLRELAEVEAVNAPHGEGIPLRKVIEEGGSIYIVGHMRVERIIRVQKMIPVRVIQLSEARDRLGDALRPVALVLDEVKYHLSRTFLEGLGAARDKGVHVAVAFQTLADLTDAGALPPEAVKGAVVENCRVKLCYQVQDPMLAEWLAMTSGTVLVDDESRQVQKNVALTETIEGGRTIRQSERYFMDQNMLQNLPTNVAVCFGLGLSQFVHISPLAVKKDPLAIAITPCHSASSAPLAAPEELI